MSSKNTRTLPLSTDQLLLTPAMQTTQPEKRKRPDVSPDNTLQNIMGAIQQMSDRFEHQLSSLSNTLATKEDIGALKTQIGGVTEKIENLQQENQELKAELEKIKLERARDRIELNRLVEHNKSKSLIYKLLCKETRTRYYRNLETALNIANNSKSLWDLVRKINGTSQSKVIKVDVQALAAHFERILCRNMPIMQHHFALPYTTILEMDREIEVVEVTDAIARCKVRKTPGEDRVPAEFFKNASPLFISQLTTTFNKIFATANVPDSFRKNVIYPIFKKGNALEPENYRGISFINAVAKVFTSVILARLTKWVKMHDILGEHQAGFREGYSTVDSIFALTAIANHHLAQKKKMYAFFVDFKAAFDTIDRNSLYLKLSNLGVSTKMINIVKSLYCQNKTTVWDGKQLSKWFTTNLGVKQGCLLSPLLFSLYVDDIMSILPGGVKMGTERIKVLMYADDMVLLADSPSGMQSMIDALYEYCRTWSLEINTQKSKILVIRESRGRRARADIWTLNGEELEIVTNYFKDGIDAQAISLIFRARTEVLRLSYVPHSSLDSRCTLCSTGEAEDTAHFIARCPMLSELRVLHFGQTRLNTTEINNFLNGSDWGSLIAYLRDATRYRQFIMDS
ncbi:hypothetical protein ACLKA6_012913 [Drosophila palustris]